MTSTRTRRTTHLGGPWRARSWLVPLFAWVIAACVAWIVHEAQTYGALTAPRWALTTIGVVVTAILTVMGVLQAPGHRFCDEIRFALGGSGLCLGGWLTTVVATDSGWTFLGVLSAALLGLTTAAVYCWGRQEQRAYELHGGRPAEPDPDPTPAPEPEPELTWEQQDKLRWERLFAKAGAAGVEYLSRDPSAAGPVLHLRLPEDGSITFKTLVQLLDRLEVAIPRQFRDVSELATLRPAALRFRKARRASGQEITSEVYLHIDVKNIMAKIIHMPDDHGPLSVYDAFPFGEITDTGETLYLTIAEIHSMIVGQTGKGKSNLLHILIYQLSRCVDVSIWAYDGKGGRTVRPWLKPWLTRRIDPNTGRPLDRPIFDWVAIDRTEAERMFAAAIAAAKIRPGLMPDGDRWIASETHPVIFLIIDELSQAVGNHVGPSYSSDTSPTSGELEKLITQIATLGRGEGVWAVTANQRDTVTAGASGDAKAQFGGKWVLPVEDADEARSMLKKSGPEAAHLAGQLEHPGSIVVQGFGLVGYVLAKLFFMGKGSTLMETVERAVLEHTQYRPVTDDGTAAELDEFGFADRWSDPDRTAWMYGRKPSAPLLRYNVPARPTPATATPTVPTGPASTLPAAGSNPWAAGAKTAATTGPAPADTVGAAELDPDEAATWEQLAERFDREGPEPDDDAPTGPVMPAAPTPAAAPQQRIRRRADYNRARPHMVRLLDQAGAEGMMAMDMHRALSDPEINEAPSRTNMYDWMGRMVADGYAVQPTGTTNGRYYHPSHWRG